MTNRDNEQLRAGSVVSVKSRSVNDPSSTVKSMDVNIIHGALDVNVPKSRVVFCEGWRCSRESRPDLGKF
jgi:hypothetical protein